MHEGIFCFGRSSTFRTNGPSLSANVCE